MGKAKYQLIGRYYKSFPNIVTVTVYKRDGSYLGEAVISLSQFNDDKQMKALILDMEEMQARGIEVALIDSATNGGRS